MLARKFENYIDYIWDNTKQTEMLYFHYGPSRQGKFQLDQIKMKKRLTLKININNNTQQWY